jgi:hypothetical protein
VVPHLMCVGSGHQLGWGGYPFVSHLLIYGVHTGRDSQARFRSAEGGAHALQRFASALHCEACLTCAALQNLRQRGAELLGGLWDPSTTMTNLYPDRARALPAGLWLWGKPSAWSPWR